MNSVWQSLFWKEWHEHKWKLVGLTSIAIGVPLGVLLAEPHELYSAYTGSLATYVVLAGLFLAMSTAGGENSRGTMPFLQSLPTPLWQAALAKLTMALVTVTVPVLLTAGFVYLIHYAFPTTWQFQVNQSARENLDSLGISTWLGVRVACSVLGVASLVIWGAAAGVNQRDEVRAGAVAGLVLLLVIWLGLLLYRSTHEFGETVQPWLATLACAAPGGLAIMGSHRYMVVDAYPLVLPLWPALIVAAIAHGALVAWYLWRFGRTPFAPSGEAAVGSTEAYYSAAPRRSPLTAILWKQFRETGPLAMLALIAILFLSALLFGMQRVYTFNAFRDHLMGVSLAVAFFVTVVAGIGVFWEDLQPGLHNFWRSRPVNLQLWFWAKMLTGLLVMATALGIPMLVAFLWDPSAWAISPGIIVDQLALIAACFLALYCWSVAAACLIRQPVYAAVFTLASFIAIPLLASAFHPTITSWGLSVDTLVQLFCLLLAAIGTAVAWGAVRFDIGWKG